MAGGERTIHTEASYIHEPMVQLPDKNVLVVGTDHGSHTFTGREQTEREIAANFANVHGVIVDSVDDLPSDEGIWDMKEALHLPERGGSFGAWAIRFAIDHNAALIAADPEGPFVTQVTFKELGKLYEDSTTNDSTSAMGLGVLLALSRSDKPMSRRKLLVASGAAALNALLTRNLVHAKQNQPNPEATPLTEEELEGQHIDEIIASEREITDADYNDPVIEEMAELSRKYLAFTNDFRNAAIADVLTLPTTDSIPGFSGEIANIPVVMGGGHLYDKTRGISWLLTHEDERIAIISQVLHTLIQDVEEGVYGYSITVPELVEFFHSYAKSYRIDRQGNYETTQLHAPTIERVLANY